MTFLQNYQPGDGAASLHLLISSLLESSATVFVLSLVDKTLQKVIARLGQREPWSTAVPRLR